MWSVLSLLCEFNLPWHDTLPTTIYSLVERRACPLTNGFNFEQGSYFLALKFCFSQEDFFNSHIVLVTTFSQLMLHDLFFLPGCHELCLLQSFVMNYQICMRFSCSSVWGFVVLVAALCCNVERPQMEKFFKHVAQFVLYITNGKVYFCVSH